MSQASNYLENKLIDWFFRGQTFTPPATLYVALHTGSPDDATNAGAPASEVTGGSYARVAVTPSLANFAGTQGAGTTSASTGTNGTTSNNVAVTFPAPTANWGTILAVSIWDAATGGNMLVYSALASSKVVNSGDGAPAFPVGSLQISIA